jgi:hypothetical protein
LRAKIGTDLATKPSGEINFIVDRGYCTFVKLFSGKQGIHTPARRDPSRGSGFAVDLVAGSIRRYLLVFVGE